MVSASAVEVIAVVPSAPTPRLMVTPPVCAAPRLMISAPVPPSMKAWLTPAAFNTMVSLPAPPSIEANVEPPVPKFEVKVNESSEDEPVNESDPAVLPASIETVCATSSNVMISTPVPPTIDLKPASTKSAPNVAVFPPLANFKISRFESLAKPASAISLKAAPIINVSIPSPPLIVDPASIA